MYIYGLLSTGVTALPVLEMIAKVITVKAHNIWLTSGDATRRKVALDFVLKGLETGALKPIIDRLFTFDEMVHVHRYLRRHAVDNAGHEHDAQLVSDHTVCHFTISTTFARSSSVFSMSTLMTRETSQIA